MSFRPTSFIQYQLGIADARYTRCKECQELFTQDNVYTGSGWRETQISGLCEKCYDNIFGYDQDEAPK